MGSVIRVEGTVHAKLRALARNENRTMGEVVAEAVRRYEREKFWAGVNEDLEQLKADPVAWRDYQEEIAFFEGGSKDGLEEEPPYFTKEEEEEIRARAYAASR